MGTIACHQQHTIHLHHTEKLVPQFFQVRIQEPLLQAYILAH